MVLVIERGGSKVDQANLTVQQNSPLSCYPGCGMARGGDISVVCEGLVCVVNEKDIFWLEVRMYQVQVVKNCQQLAFVLQSEELCHLQATLVNNCRAKLCI